MKAEGYATFQCVLNHHLKFNLCCCHYLIIFHIIFQAVPTAKGQALADEYGIKFFETVSKLSN